jgi:hypothetical protein
MLNSDREKVRREVEVYCGLYGITPPFEISGLYDLQEEWRVKKFPFAGEAGCYVFYSDKYQLIYIGKVSQRHSLGSRIASYFRWDLTKSHIEPKHTWTFPPRYVQTIKTHHPFEAPSLEEFLIVKLEPRDNRSGLPRQRAAASTLPPA